MSVGRVGKKYVASPVPNLSSIFAARYLLIILGG
jgi:hypothetical protein